MRDQHIWEAIPGAERFSTALEVKLPTPKPGLLVHSGIFSPFHPISKGNFLPWADKEGKSMQTALCSACVHMQPCLSVNKFI